MGIHVAWSLLHCVLHYAIFRLWRILFKLCTAMYVDVRSPTAQHLIHLPTVHRQTENVKRLRRAAPNHDAGDGPPRDNNCQSDLHIVNNIIDSKECSHFVCYDLNSFYEDYKDTSLPLYRKHYKLFSQLHIFTSYCQVLCAVRP